MADFVRFMTDFLLIMSFLLLKYKIFCTAHIVVFIVICSGFVEIVV